MRKSTLERRKQSLRRRFVGRGIATNRAPRGYPRKTNNIPNTNERKKETLSLSFSSRGCRREGWATCARVISIKVAPFATLKSPLSPDCSPMEQRRGRHLLAGVELLPFSPKGPKVEHLRNRVRWGAALSHENGSANYRAYGMNGTFLTIRSLTTTTGHGHGHGDDQRRTGRETREGRGTRGGKKRRAIVGSDDGWMKEHAVNKIRMIVKGD